MTMALGNTSTIGATVRMQALLSAASAARETANIPKPAGEETDKLQTATAPARTDAAGGTEWPRREASSDGPRQEVDRRIEDGKSVRITVVSYSDGSMESLTQFKADDLMLEVAGSLADTFQDVGKPSDWGQRGMLLNKTA